MNEVKSFYVFFRTQVRKNILILVPVALFILFIIYLYILIRAFDFASDLD